MKTSGILGEFTSILLLSLFCIAQPSQAAKPIALRYQPPDGNTNIYNVQVETRSENGTEILAGNLFVVTRVVSSNVFSFSLRGTLTPRRESGTPLRPMIYSGTYRPSMPVSFNEGNEFQFDELGCILRMAGDYPLTIPLGSIAQIFLEPFAAKAESRWETTGELAVLDEPANLGPANSFISSQPYGMSFFSGPYMGSRNQIGVIPVMRRMRYEIKTIEPSTVTISKRVNIESYLQFGKEPRISGSSDGEIAFDRELGFIRSAEMEGKAVVNTDTVTRRTSVSLKIKLLEGAERESALKTTTITQSGQPPKKLTTEDVQKLVDDLKSSDASTRMAAAGKLQTSQLPEAPAELLDWAVQNVDEKDTMTHLAAVKVLSDWGTTEHVPLLLKLLNDEEFSGRHNVIRGLGRLKDKRAAEPLALLLARGGSDAYSAVDALGKIGSDAEDAVLALLKEKHNETRRNACNVLKQIGTKKSIEPLRELMLSTDRMLSDAAGEAVRSIMARQ